MPQTDKREQFVQLLTRHQSALRAFVHALIPDWHAAEDVLQETNTVLWRKSNQFQPGTNFRAWAFTIANHQVRSARLKFSREKQRMSETAAEHVAAEAADRLSNLDERREALEACYRRLNDAQRELMRRRYTDNESVTKIAESIGRPVGSIRQTLYRIRQALADCIERQLPGAGVQS